MWNSKYCTRFDCGAPDWFNRATLGILRYFKGSDHVVVITSGIQQTLVCWMVVADERLHRWAAAVIWSSVTRIQHRYLVVW